MQAYILSRTISKLLHIIGQIFTLDKGVPYLSFHTRLRRILKLVNTKFGLKQLGTSLYHIKMHFISSHLGVAHECDRQTDRPPLAIASSNIARCMLMRRMHLHTDVADIAVKVFNDVTMNSAVERRQVPVTTSQFV